MARKLKPCGTTAAYRRHKRHSEEPCADCKRAMSDETRAKKAAKRNTSTVEISSGETTVQVVDFAGAVNSDANISPLEEAMDSLRIVRATLQSDNCLPKDIGALTKRRDELVDRIVKLRKQEAEDAEDGEIGEDEEWDEAAI